jgi:predicted nucleotidyltransferase
VSNAAPDTLGADVLALIPGVQACWLYGSGAKDALRQDSDLDVAVLLPQPMGSIDKLAWTQGLGKLWNRHVDLVDFARTTTVLQQQILTTGKRLFCQDAAKTDAYEAFCRTEYLNLQARRAPQLAEIFKRGTVFA